MSKETYGGALFGAIEAVGSGEDRVAPYFRQGLPRRDVEHLAKAAISRSGAEAAGVDPLQIEIVDN